MSIHNCRYHFIAGIPRSGSTLLAGILSQNPRFHANMTSPVKYIIDACMLGMSEKYEASVWLDEARRVEIIRGLFDSFYYDTAKPVVFDTNRLWPSHMSALALLYPTSKVICCVRDVSWVVDSLEHVYIDNALRTSKYGFPETVYGRVTFNLSADGPLGRALNSLREGLFGEHRSKMLLVPYEKLTEKPAYALREIYDFVEEPYFEHDFDDVQYRDGVKFDAYQGTPGMHDVRPIVARNQRRTILPPELFEAASQLSFWDVPNGLPHGVRMI